jgi:hypothetical protein
MMSRMPGWISFCSSHFLLPCLVFASSAVADGEVDLGLGTVTSDLLSALLRSGAGISAVAHQESHADRIRSRREEARSTGVGVGARGTARRAIDRPCIGILRCACLASDALIYSISSLQCISMSHCSHLHRAVHGCSRRSSAARALMIIALIDPPSRSSIPLSWHSRAGDAIGCRAISFSLSLSEQQEKAATVEPAALLAAEPAECAEAARAHRRAALSWYHRC